MGKTTKYPSSSTGTLSINGNPLVTTTSEDNKTTTNYNLSDTQKAINDYVENSLLSSISQINTFLPETVENINEEVAAYTQNGIDTINDLYTPMIKDLENDVASRFGNLDNSIFLSNLGDIESQRANSVSDFMQDVQSKQSDLIDNELEKQYDYLNFLTNYQDQSYQNILDTLGLNTMSSSSSSSSASSYNSNNIENIIKMASLALMSL